MAYAKVYLEDELGTTIDEQRAWFDLDSDFVLRNAYAIAFKVGKERVIRAPKRVGRLFVRVHVGGSGWMGPEEVSPIASMFDGDVLRFPAGRFELRFVG